jgi:hypothetical protein
VALFYRAETTNVKQELLADGHKICKTLREIAKLYCLPFLIGFVTNFKQWQIIDYDMDHEISCVAGPQILRRLQSLTNPEQPSPE